MASTPILPPSGETELWRAIKRIERKIDLLLSTYECREPTGIFTSLGEKLCRLDLGHSGAHSPDPPYGRESNYPQPRR